MLDLIRRLHGLLFSSDLMTHFQEHLLDNSVDYVALLDVITALNLEFSHDCNDQVGQSLVLVEADLDFLWLSTVNRRALDSSTNASCGCLAWIKCLSLLLLGLLNMGLLLLCLLQPLLVSLFIDLFLEHLELDVVLLDVDIAVAEKSADLADIVGLDDIIAVSTSHCLGETNQ